MTRQSDYSAPVQKELAAKKTYTKLESQVMKFLDAYEKESWEAIGRTGDSGIASLNYVQQLVNIFKKNGWKPE